MKPHIDTNGKTMLNLKTRSPFSVLNKTQYLRRNFSILIVFSLFFAVASCDDGTTKPPPDPPPAPTPTPPAPTTITKTLYLGVSGQPGAHPITIEYKSSVTVAQTDLDKIQNRLDYLNTSSEAFDIALVANIKTRTNIKIIIEDAASYGANNYRVIDGRTMAIRNAWLSTATNGQVYTMLFDGFTAMVATPL